MDGASGTDEKEDVLRSDILYDQDRKDAEDSIPTAGLKDIALMIFINFLSFVCFAIVLPSLAVYVDNLQGSTHHSVSRCVTDNSWLIGPLVAINSFGTLLGSPVLGKWADARTVRESIFISLVLMIFGNLLYVFSDFPSFKGSIYLLFFSRFIVGVASANYAPASAYLTYATKVQHRNIVMGVNSAAGILGFIIGPAIAAAISNINVEIWYIKFNELSNPGWASAALAVGAMLFLPIFREIPSTAKQARKVMEQANQSQKYAENMNYAINMTEDEDTDPEFDSVYEDGIISYRPANANLSTKRPSTRQQSSKYFGAGSVILEHHSEVTIESYDHNLCYRMGKSIVGSLLPKESHKVPWVGVCVCLVLQFCFYLSYTVFETIGPPLAISLYCEKYGWGVFYNGLMFAVVGILSIGALVSQVLLSFIVSDRITLLICIVFMLGGYAMLIVPNAPIFVFLPGVVISSMAFSAGVAQLISLYSKLCNEVEQGVMMGWLSLSGSFSRMIGPIGASLLWVHVGTSAVFVAVCFFLAIALAANAIFFLCLKPKPTPSEEDGPETKPLTFESE